MKTFFKLFGLFTVCAIAVGIMLDDGEPRPVKQQITSLSPEEQQDRLIQLMLNPDESFIRRAEARRTLEAMGAEVVAKHRDSIRKFAAEQRKYGVLIGMTEQDVLYSSWGKPTRVNRSTHSWGVREQWVFGGGNYLYFENGILKSIQH
jgi:hypothetical protein